MPNGRSLFKRLLMVVACVGALAAAGPAVAQANNIKISADLALTIGTPAAPNVTWARSQGGQVYAKVLIVASSTSK